MKKTFKKLIVYICLVMLVMSFSGCSQFIDLGSARDYTQMSVSVTANKQHIFCDTNQIFQGNNYVRASCNEGEFTNYSSMVEVANKVKRANVMISISKDNTTSYGSGVIVDINGGLNKNEYYVMTCQHVIRNGGIITICVPDTKGRNYGDLKYDENYIFSGKIGYGKQEDAQNSVCLVGGDRDGDIAILKLKVGNRVDANSSPVSIEKAIFPNSSSVSISYGEQVFAIGNPAGSLPMTFLNGYISYLERTDVFGSVGIMTNLIQHDCAITHGNSGGGLYNMKGYLIGITNGGISQSAGLNYAIPYYTYYDSTEYGFMYIAKQLIESNNDVNYGYVKGRWDLGASSKQTKTRVGGSCVMIDSVEVNSIAYGKLKTGDYVTKIEFMYNGKNKEFAVTDQDSFNEAIFMAREDLTLSQASEIKFTIQRAK